MENIQKYLLENKERRLIVDVSSGEETPFVIGIIEPNHSTKALDCKMSADAGTLEKAIRRLDTLIFYSEMVKTNKE